MLKKKHVDKILITMLRSNKGTSDLNFTAGKPLQVESSGKLVPVVFDPPVEKLTSFQTEMLAMGVIGSDRGNLENLVKSGSCDCAYEVPGECRFRVNVFRQRRQYSMVLRKLETKILTIDDLGLPGIFKDLAAEKNGLVLITGSTGSGKSTTLAAVLNEMNETRSIHILTIEDPIEYVHPHKKATFNQRELGTDFDTFSSSLRAALRQAPKVILIGEMRDRETVEIGLAAASTGHLVLSTLHSIDCGQTINRVVGMFDKDEELQIRARLAECLRYVVNQRLLPKEGGGRVPCQEIMGINLRVKELVLGGESEGKTFYDVIGVGRNRGWQTHDQALTDLFEEAKITEETAIAYASNKPVLSRAIDRIKQVRGEEDKDALSLSLDTTAVEANNLIKSTWPAAGTAFPLSAKVPPESTMVVYEPAVEVKGNQAILVFPVKAQGQVPGVSMMNPKGQLVMNAKPGGGSGVMISYTEWSLESLTLGVEELTPKAEQNLKTLVQKAFPEKIELTNPRLTPIKLEALSRLAEIGRLRHVQAIKTVLVKATDTAEIAAIEKLIETIQERGE